MNDGDPKFSSDKMKRGNPSKGSIFVFFIIGGLLVGLPLILVLTWSSTPCRGAVQVFCLGSHLYRMSVLIFPYVMLSGGAIIGYNMKRISDMIFASQEEEEDSGLS